MVQNLRAYLILHAIKTEWIMCVQEKNEVLSVPHRPRLKSIKISGDLSIATKQNKLQKYFPRGGKKLAFCYPGVAFATPWHPMATGLLQAYLSLPPRNCSVYLLAK